MPATKEDVIPLSGSSCYFAAVAITMAVASVPVAMAAVTIAACGLSCFSSSAEDAETITASAASRIRKKGTANAVPFLVL